MLATEADAPDKILTPADQHSPASTSFMDLLKHPDRFVRRHIGPGPDETREMLKLLACSTLDELIDSAVPATIRLKLLKIGTVIVRNTRRIRLLFSSAYPYAGLLRTVLARLSSG